MPVPAVAEAMPWSVGAERAVQELIWMGSRVPERELRPYLEGACYVAGIRRDTPETDATRIRSSEMSTQLTPVQALEVYLKTQPHLQSKREELLKRGQALIAEVAPDTVELG